MPLKKLQLELMYLFVNLLSPSKTHSESYLTIHGSSYKCCINFFTNARVASIHPFFSDISQFFVGNMSFFCVSMIVLKNVMFVTSSIHLIDWSISSC